MKYKAVLFDLDGTLLDTIEDLANSVNSVLSRYGYPAHSLNEYRFFVGNGLRNLVLKALPTNERSEANIDRCLDELREEYGKRWAEKTKPYPGVPELLDSLTANGIKMAILSNKADNFTRQIISTLLPDWRFEVVYGERPSVPRKPDPTAALDIARSLGISPSEFLYLGDTDVDMKTANAAGMYAVGALWGFRPKEELIANGSKVLLEKPTDLLKLL